MLETIYNREAVVAAIERYKNYGVNSDEAYLCVIADALSEELDHAGQDILKVCQGALDDSNYHEIANYIGELLTNLEANELVQRND